MRSESGPFTRYRTPDVRVSFTIWAEIDPALITRELGMEPTRVARKGVPRRPGARPPVASYWMWGTPSRTTGDATAVLDEAIEHVQTIAGPLLTIKKKWNASFVFTVIATVDVDELVGVPGLYVDQSRMRALLELNADFDMDVTLVAD